MLAAKNAPSQKRRHAALSRLLRNSIETARKMSANSSSMNGR